MIEPRESSPVFVVFEGLDGSGKSTCAQALAQEMDAELMTTPSPEVRSFREQIISSFAGCQEACQLFYLATVFSASRQIEKLLAHGRSVVLDRYFLSTQAYAAFRRSNLDLDALCSKLVPADITVFIDVPLEVRRSRLMNRGVSDADRETLSREANSILERTHNERFGISVVGRLLRLNGDQLAPKEVVARVLGEMNRIQAGLSPRRRGSSTSRILASNRGG